MVFEEHVAYYLDRYLGNYVKGLSKEALKISVWQGNVELTNMQLKPEALNSLKLPIKVKAGFLGSVKLKVPWSRLGQEPVVVLLDRIYLLAEPATDLDQGTNGDAVQEAKLKRVKDTEAKLLERKADDAKKEELNNTSWLGSLISTIIGNLKLSITNIHIRYEDCESNPGHPFAAGLTLEKLAAVTVDEGGKETFITGGSLDRIQKSGELQRLAFYFDPDVQPWTPEKKWEHLLPKEWTKVFGPGIGEKTDVDGDGSKVNRSCRHHYLLAPVGGTARYSKLANRDARTPDQPAQKAIVTLDNVTIGLSEVQYRDALKMVENFSTFNKRLKYAHYRPSEPIKKNRRAWWQYAYKAILEQQKQASGNISWNRLVKLSELRKRYVSKYVMALQSNPKRTTVDDDKEIQNMDRELDTDIIIQWRMLAHTYVDQSRAQDQRRQQQQQKQQSWWLPFGWGGQGNGEDEKPVKFTEDEWEQLNQLIGYQQGKQSNVLRGQEPPDMLHTVLEVRMRRNATKLVAANDDIIMELSASELHVTLQIYPETTKFDLELASYQLSCPEGLLMESATKAEAVNATFIYLPMEGNLDWSLAARCSPCFVTVFMPSVNRVIAFFRTSRAVSRTVALDTATALQSTLDEVTRNAQQQINKALKDRPRFKMDLDIAAPKVTIPTEFYPDGVQQSKLLLDFGHFNLQTDLDDKPMESAEEKDLYMRFRIKLTDVSAVLVDGDYDWKQNFGDFHQAFEEGKSGGKAARMLPLLEKCGVMVALQQICVPHPQYPTTRVAVRLPSLAFQFSPARYHRLMQVTKVFQSSSPDESASVRPWEPSDFEGHVSVLAWKGVGHREAVWQHRYAVLSGPFLYLLESPSSQSYKYCCSLIGKQATIVPPESIGGVPYVLAICDAGHFKDKVAESVNALLIRFEDETSMNNWQARITGAIYQASAPVAIAGFAGSKEHEDAEDAVVEASEGNEKLNPAEQESFFLIGALDELKIVISNSKVDDYNSPELLLGTEIRLLELRAIGTKVEFAMRTYDMSVGAVLQALEVEDKFHGHVAPSCKYLARSYIKTTPKIMGSTPVSNGRSGHGKQHRHRPPNGRRCPKRRQSSENDRFFDAEEEFLDAENQSKGRGHALSRSSGSLSRFFDAKEEGNDLTGDDQEPPSFRHDSGLLPATGGRDDGQDSLNEGEENFVKAQVIMRSQDSPDYGNVDKEVKVTLATLSFFLNRPTVLALLDLVTAINADVEPNDPNPPPSSTESDAIVSTIDPNAIDGNGENDDPRRSFDRHDSVVKGLLGRGKNRVVFLVVLNMDRAEISLNLEDGAQLSLLSQEDLHTEIKVFPASFGIKVALGNLKMSDGSLNNDHPYHYICNMRDPQGTSFIELEFLSFNKEDEDYQGYEYSIKGKLSELRIVFLNRFTQEISSYFMGLVPQNSGYVVKLKDRFTDVEKFFTQSEIEGQPALKLDLSLSKPVIIMPRSTKSTDFLELDILHINVSNTFQWLGGEKDELGAVRLETTTLQLEDLHLVVGVGGKTGEGIIQEANGLSLVVRRPIRDLWHQLPAVEAAVKIESLKAALSDKEYQVITECAVTNMAETPNLPPPVVEKVSDDEKDGQDIELDARPTESNAVEGPRADGNSGDGGETWTTIKVGVGIKNVELGLFKGEARDAPLASVQVTGVWAAYMSNSVQESSIMASLQKFSVRDDREGTDSEMRYMIGNADDENHDMLEAKVHDEENDGSSSKQESKSSLTRLVMDANLSPTAQTITLRIQRPRLLVALDFLLAVAEFFIPSMHAMVSDGKGGDENPLEMQNAVFLDVPVYRQAEKEITLSPKKPLVADKVGIYDYVYDGRGGTIRLLDRKGADLRDFAREVIIFVGDDKRLTFKNVVIQNGDFIDSCISLGSNSSYVASEDDGVFLEGQPEKPADAYSYKESAVDGQDEHPSVDQADAKPTVEIIFNLQAIAPELTFYDSINRPADSVLAPERLLRARMNVFSRLILKGEDMELNAQVNGLTVEASSGIHVLEPVDMTVKFTKVSGKQHIHVAMSEVVTNFSFSVVHLILRLQTDVMSFLRITSEQTTVRCSEFDKIWADEGEKSGANCITFWRPRAPPGFATLGDCLTPRDETPSKGVIAVNMSLARLRRPVDFVLVWSSYENVRKRYGADHDDQVAHCSVWFPVAPRGYVALGCVASAGADPPPPNACFCVLAALVTQCYMRDCIIISRNSGDEAPDGKKLAFWRVDNSTGSFFTEGHSVLEKSFIPHELRQIITSYESFPVQETKPPRSVTSVSNQQTPLRDLPPRQSLAPSLSSGRMYESIARFELIWWSKGSGSKKGISIWRPVVPTGCVIFGDIAVEGFLPPDVGLALRETEETGHFCKPLRFYCRGHIPRRKSMGTVSFWFPVAPVNYVAMGCIASTTSNSPPNAMDLIRCVRKDLVIGANFNNSSLWDTSCLKSSSDVLSIWPVENEAHTFFVIRKIKTPPKELALRLAEYQASSAPDNLVSDVEVKRISATFYDDFGGLMAPLVDISLSGITGSLHGRMEAMSCSANFTLTAASFNGKYRAWEPLVERWDGRLRYAYSSDPENKARPTVTHIRLTASSDFNINLSVANINMLLEAYASWNRMNRLEDKTKKQFSLDSKGRSSSKPALDVKSQERLSCVTHNELGEELFLRVVENNHSKVLSLPPEGSVSVRLPTAHSTEEPGAKATTKRNPTKFVALKIGEAQIPRDEGIGGRDYMVAIRVVPRAQSSDQRQLQYQSARTRCASPEASASSDKVIIRWNEIFVFEVETEEGNTAEIVITDVSRGAPVGFCSTQLTQRKTKQSNQESETHLPWSEVEPEWELVYRTQSELMEDHLGGPCGKISVAKQLFSIVAESVKDGTRQESGTLQFSLSPEGPWNEVGLNYALGAAPWQVNDDTIASEFYVDGGVKHLLIRSLVVVQNGTDFEVEVSLCAVSALGLRTTTVENGGGEIVEEEVFENERYQPLAGWGSKWPGHLLPTDPGQYSDRHFKESSEEFPAVKLPPGWKWTGDWRVDEIDDVDEEGWSYAFDFHNMKWPPPANGSGKVLSFVRRRRWVRSRQSVGGRTRVNVGTIPPGGTMPLPVACLRATTSDYCLQIRPRFGGYNSGSYQWSQVDTRKGFRDRGSKHESLKEIRIQSLIETEELLKCSTEASSSSSSDKDIWFCLEITGTVVGKDAEMDPIKDWKLVITAPLMLRNYLPVQSEYSVSEKHIGRGLLVRERGIIKSGEAAGIFHADLNKALHLTWLPQGGWQPKKETVLISHPYRDVESRMCYISSRTSRSIEVMIEHDQEVKGVAAKVVKMYVPCWLDCAKCPPLQFRLIDIQHSVESKLMKGSEQDHRTQPIEGVTMGKVKEHINQEELINNQTIVSDIEFGTTGLSVAVTSSCPDIFGPASPLGALRDPDGSAELRGIAENGSYYRFLVTPTSCPLQFVKTKVLRIRPYILFTNWFGQAMYMKQKGNDDVKTLNTSDWRVSFPFMEAEESGLLQIKVDGCQWSLPFPVEKETTMHINLRKEGGGRRTVRVEIRGYEEGSRFLVLFRLGSARGPYRLDNRTSKSMEFRQYGLDDNGWQNLLPHSTKTFAWEDYCREQLLEVAADGSTVTLDVNKIGDHPLLNSGEDSTSVCIRVLELMEVKTVRFYEEIVDFETLEEYGEISVSSSSRQDSGGNEEVEDEASDQTEIVVDIPKLGLSVIDHKPQEIVYLFLGDVLFTYQMGFGERISSLKLRIGDMQLDNQLPLAWMPVLLAPEGRSEERDFLLTATLTMYDDNVEATRVFPYIGVQVQSGLRVNVHEPIIWAIVKMYNNLHLDRLSEGSEVVQVDPEFRIDLIDVSEVRLKLTLETAPAARPRGMLGYWGPLVTGLGNTNKMPIRLSNVLHKDRYIRNSQIVPAVTSRIRRDLIHQPLLLLTGVDLFGNASSTIGTLSKGVAQLASDGKYLRLRSKKDRARNLSGLGDALLQGTEALARGFAYGLTGVVTKPITNARQYGFVGFFHGVGKAAVGFVMLPVSGMLEFVSLTVNGVGVSCTHCFEIFDKDSHVTRVRLPRAVRGDGIMQEYDEYAALGQALLQMAQSGALCGFRDAFSEPAKYAWSDFYENHVDLPKHRVLMLTNRRVMMLARPASHFHNPEKLFTEPSTILWEVPWRNVLAVEIAANQTHYVVIHLRWSTKTFAQVIKCYERSLEGSVPHAKKVARSIREVWKKYGPDRETIMVEEVRHAHHLRLIPSSLRSKRSNPGSIREDGLVESSSPAASRGLARGDPVGLTKEVVLFKRIWTSEQEAGFSCSICSLGPPAGELCTIWRPQAPEGYVCVGDVAHQGNEPPAVAVTYKHEDGMFAKPTGYDLVWRNWKDGFVEHISIWMPRAPHGYAALGCVAVAGYVEPDGDACWCIREELTEHTDFEESLVWKAPVSSPWNSYIYAISCEALTFQALRETAEKAGIRPRRVKPIRGSEIDPDVYHRV